MIGRRTLVLGALALAAAPNTTLAQSRTFLNGELNRSQGTFDWTNGGGDPLHHQLRADAFAQALTVSRLNLDAATQAGLRATLSRSPMSRFDLQQLEGHVIGDVMMSGNGWLALRPRIVTSRWRSGRSTMASWWTWTNPSTSERWEIYAADVCGNLILTRLGQPVPCVCGPSDACA